nr:hypothetical protein [Tanacetum cinerariifolium]
MEHSNPTLAKIPIMDTGKFEQWKFRIQQYLQNKHYALWEVIEFGDSFEAPKNDATTGSASEGSTKKKGRTVAVTTEDMLKRRNDVKARTTLLLALPDEHQLRFSKYKTAQELWAAILKTFDGNEATRKTIKNLLKKQYVNFKAEGKETLEQTLNTLSDLDTMSLDDLYNHLKVYEPEVQKKSNSQNMAFISSEKNNSGNGEVNTASIPTASTKVSPASANITAASISLDTVCAYIASQSSGSQIKYEDINQIDEDDIEEIDIKWNMALLSMKADRYWKKTRKKISIQGTDVVGFDKSKVECFNCHKMGHFARECRAPRSQDRGQDWSFLANEEENHALVTDEEAPTEFSLMAKSSYDNEVFDSSLCSKACKKNTDSLNSKITNLNKKLSDSKNMLYHYKLGLSQVEARLVEFKNQEIKFCEKIRGLEFNVESKNNRIERLTKELEELKKEKEGLDTKLTDDTITDYTKPSPSIESNPNDLQNNSSSISEIGKSTSSILSKPEIKFVKAAYSPTVIKTNKDETVRKPSVKYAEMYRKTSKSSNVEKGKSWPKNKYTHKSLPPRTAIHKTDRTPVAVNRTYVNSARPKTTQDLMIILILRVKRLERELKARTPPLKIYYVEVRGRSRTMDINIDQLVALNEALVPHASRLRIGKSNYRLISDITSKESTLQVVYDVLRLTMFYKAFLVIADTFDELPFEEEILAFQRYLGHSKEIKKITDVNINHGDHLLQLSISASVGKVQVDHKDANKSNEMYYPRIIKVIINFFMTKIPSIPRRNKVNWHYVRDDQMFTTIKPITRHQNTQQFGAMLPIELTNEDIRNSAAYKEYYAIALGAAPPKAKVSVRKTQSSFDTTMPHLMTAGTRLSISTKGKQHAKSSKAKGLSVLSEVALTEAEQIKVPDVPTDESDEEISWKSSDEDDDDVDDQSDADDDNDDDQEDEDEQDNDDQDDNDDDQDSDNDSDDFVHPKLSTHDEKTKDEESFDPIVQTPDVNINLEGRNVQLTDVNATQVLEDTNVTLTPLNTDFQQQSSSLSSQFIMSMLNPSPDTCIDSLFKSTHRVDVRVTTTVVPLLVTTPTLPPPSISIIYVDHWMNEAVKVAVQLQSDRLRDEAQAENEDFINKLDENIQKIIKELEAKVLTRSSNSSKTSYAVAADLSELELKKILIEKMESNKSINRSDEQRNLYKALVDAYECDKIILDTYGDTFTLKRHRDDPDKDEEPSTGSDQGSRRIREGKEPESTSALKEKASKTAGKSTKGSKFHQKTASESAPAEKPMQTIKDLEKPSHQEFETGVADDQPVAEAYQHPECDLAKQADTRASFNELMDTPIDFSAFLINRLNVDTLTPELLAGPTYELMKGSCKSLSQAPVSYDKYALWGISHWGRKHQQFYGFAINRESARDVYSKRRIIAVTELQIVEWHNYKHLDWINVHRDDDKLYKFKEGDLKRLRIQDIEDMLLLLVQGKLTNLTVEERFAFNSSLEFQDTANSGKNKEQRLWFFYQMETEKVSDRFMAPYFVNGLKVYVGEINLGVEENMILNKYAVKLCLEHEVERGNKVVKKELIVALTDKIYFVKFIINPEEDDVEPGMIFGSSFLRMTNANTDFWVGTITIFLDIDPFLEETEEEEKRNDDWDHLLDFNINDIPLLGEQGLRPFVCKMRKSSHNKKRAIENLNFFYQDIGTSSLADGLLIQEEAAKEALAIRMSQKFSLLEEERPIVETMAYHDKYKKILDEVWKDKVELDGKIVKEEEAVKRIKSEALKENDNPGTLIFLIRLEG